jgi:signal transduction histidine kinase
MNTILKAPIDRRTWLATAHVIGDLPVSVVTFTVVITLLSLAAGLAVTFLLAVPVAWLLVVCSAGLGRFERARAAALLGTDVNDPHRPAVGGWLARLRQRMSSAATWREIAYHLLLLPVGCTGASLVIAGWSGALAVLGLPLIAHLSADRSVHVGLFDVHGASVWWGVPAGVAALFVAPWIARGWGRLDAALVRSLLGSGRTAELRQRVTTLASSRSLAVDAAEEERRRIERDLHDGAQQRLVALAMDIGMAKAKFDSDPTAARAMLDEAHDEAKRAIVELRDLARGIHPVALTDRGLPGAIPGLADRAPFHVDVHVDVPDRPSPAVEGIAYFIVAEALTNVAKHSDARSSAVEVVRHGDRLSVTVSDDGRGGADVAVGSGLRGLAARAASVDGTFTVTSPVGGPTVVRAELPTSSEVSA